MWVSPFRDLRINGYLLLPEAYRSLSRLSSALSAKASALCSFCLTFAFHHPSVGDAVVDSHCLINKFIDVFLSNVLRLYQGYLIKFNQIYMYAVFKVQYPGLNYLRPNGLKWTRTTDLTLIRRAL